MNKIFLGMMLTFLSASFYAFNSGNKDFILKENSLYSIGNMPTQDTISPALTKSKEKTAYDYLFEGKKTETAKGDFLTLHKTDYNLYFELPIKYLKRPILFGTTITSASDPSILTIGTKTSEPLLFYFDIQGDKVILKKVNTKTYAPEEDESIKSTLQNNFNDPTITAFRLEAYTPDSTAVVFDMSSIVSRDNPMVSVIPQKMNGNNITAYSNGELASVQAIKAFDDNASIRTELSYTVSINGSDFSTIAKDKPFTTEITHTFLLLPKKKITPRIADARVGIASTEKIGFFKGQNHIEPIYFTKRWNLTPQNLQAYAQGKLSNPIKPIVFYVDNAFPQSWKKPIKEGILRWNKAFEKIGFKDAIQVKDFPKNDPNFDADNLKYSCIRYIPYLKESLISDFWADPNTGEIINGSLLIFNNIGDFLYKKRFIQTANVDTSIRGKKLPQEIFDQSLAYVVSQKIGTILGLEINKAGSSSVAVESLRNKNFTQKYGLTSSIMDEVYFNYVAQPKDKGVRLSSYDLGVYDFYAIDYNYRYLTEKNVQKQYDILAKMVDKQSVKPEYRYVPEQNMGILDPSVIGNDLGNDPLTASDYGIRNLQNITKNLPKWIKDDEDSRIKNMLYELSAQQFKEYFQNVMYLIGGIYVNNSKENSGIPRFKVTDKKKQQESLIWCIDKIKNLREYANIKLEKRNFVGISPYDKILESMASELLGTNKKVANAFYLDTKSYSQKDFFEDLYNEIFKSTLEGKTPNNNELFLEKYFVESALNSVEGKITNKSSNNSSYGGMNYYFTSDNNPQKSITEGGFGIPNQPLYPKISAQDQSDMYYYKALLELEPVLKNALEQTPDKSLKAHYNYLLVKIRKITNAQ